jgi:hypothetical protein
MKIPWFNDPGDTTVGSKIPSDKISLCADIQSNKKKCQQG